MKELFPREIDRDRCIAGVDEAGRGPLAGPVVAAAVILDRGFFIKGINDSKKLSSQNREALAGEIKKHALAWAIASVQHDEIDSLNILNATLLAMKKAVEQLDKTPDHVQVDGNRVPVLNCSVEAIIKGDSLVDSIAAASILAKVERDAIMIKMDAKYPGYGFARHKGYPTKQHIEALKLQGICEIHRKSYAPVQQHISEHHLR